MASAADIRRELHELKGDPKRDYQPLLERIGDAKVVMIGEASHGTHEFYEQRAEITKRLCTEKNFRMVMVEGDWPHAARLTRYVRCLSGDKSAAEALSSFTRFPTWMWRNTVVPDFVEWLHTINQERLEKNEGVPSLVGDNLVGVYGMDIYSMHEAIDEVLDYLKEKDPRCFERAKQRYMQFDHFGDEPQLYGVATACGFQGCEEEVVEQLLELRRHAADFIHGDQDRDKYVRTDEQFFAELNATVVQSAEEYYRAMYSGQGNCWNLRDSHFFRVFQEVVKHYEQTTHDAPKVAVWSHNCHVGDARATESSWRRGELSFGQLVREHYGRDCVSIGFTTHRGSVTAADAWDEPAKNKTVPPAVPASYEDLLHQVGVERFMLDLSKVDLNDVRPIRSIGVVYRPEVERWSHYFDTRLSQKFDVLLHLDVTRAVEPLDPGPEWRPVPTEGEGSSSARADGAYV